MQINHKKKAESLAAVIIAVFILSIALLGIMNVVSFSRDTAIDYETEMFKHIITSNSDALIKNFEFDNLTNNETFYLYKDVENLEFKILTGSTNSGSQYIDILGNRIEDLDASLGNIYKREFIHQSDILKHSLDPSEVPNLVFHFDAQNPYGNNTHPSDGTNISTWIDLANGYNAESVTGNSQSIQSGLSTPNIRENIINGFPGIEFNGINNIYQLPLNADISNDDNGVYDKVYTQKSFSLVFQTSDDVISEQVIYEQGGVSTGYNFMIDDGNLFAGIHNIANGFAEWDNGHTFKSVSLGEALPNTTYYVTVVQDSNNFDENGDIVDELNKLQIFLNGEIVSETDHVDPQGEHHIAGIGGVNEWNVHAGNGNVIRRSSGYCDNQCLFFKGYIGEFTSWNHALTPAEVRGMHNYLLEKWLGGKESINYSIINTKVAKYNSN